MENTRPMNTPTVRRAWLEGRRSAVRSPRCGRFSLRCGVSRGQPQFLAPTADALARCGPAISQFQRHNSEFVVGGSHVAYANCCRK
jgi:hypothetical protein